jgi:eukaryotic-like serine/threonine-protein kinase
MGDFTVCPACGSALPFDAPGGLCAPCLLRQGFEHHESRPLGNGSADTLENGEWSVPGESTTSHRSPRYQLLGEIARGGMGAVIKGRDPDLGRDLAIKVLLEKHRCHPELVRRFVEEAQIGGQLQHPGVVPVYELGKFGDNRPYFAMKLVQGRTLAAVLAARTSVTDELAQLLDIFEQVCQTMAYAHARGVIHRDLKPSNIMVGNFGEVQVMDWGLAKVLERGGAADDPAARPSHEPPSAWIAPGDSHSAISKAGSVLGTPAYMAPEQARGDLDQINERSDVFGLGAILCEILTGRPPYVSTATATVEDLAISGALDSAFERLAVCGADPELIELARRCLAALPADRPLDAGIVASEMTGYLRGMQERLRQTELERARAQAWASAEKARRRLAVGLAAAIVGLVVTTCGTAAWMLHQHDVRSARVDLMVHEARMLTNQAESAGDDLSKWTSAQEAARRVLALADDARDPAAKRQIASLVSYVDGRAQKAQADDALLNRLAGVREAIDDNPTTVIAGGYAWAFKLAELFPDVRPPEETGRAIANRPVRTAVAIAAALDHYASLRLECGDTATALRITAAARIADPDEFRGRLRTALMEPRKSARRAALAELSRLASAADLPPVTAALLASGLLKAGDPTAALTLLVPAQRRHPADPWLAQTLAKALEQQGRGGEAIRYFLIARAARPNSVHALAHALERHGERTEAIAVLQEAVRLNPSSTRDLKCLAFALESAGRSREAAEMFSAVLKAGRDALRLHPDDSLHHGLCHIATEHPEWTSEVIDAYRAAIQQNPDDASLQFYMGTILERTRQTADAVAAYREATRMMPGFAEAHLSLGLVLLQGTHDYQGALAAFQDLVRLRPDQPAVHCLLGKAFQGIGRIDAAIAAYRAAIRVTPDFAEAYCDLGGVFCDLRHQEEEGRTLLREAIRLKPDDPCAHNFLAQSLARSSQFDQAITEYRTAIRLVPNAANIHYNLAVALQHERQTAAAIAEYRAAIRLNSQLAEGHCNLGQLLRSEGQYAESLVAFERGHLLGQKRPTWSYPSDKWVARARRLARLEPELPTLLADDTRPADAVLYLDLALASSVKGLHSLAARFFARALAVDPRAASDSADPDCFNAACSTAKAGCGKTSDQPPPDRVERAKLRGQALSWLESEFAAALEQAANASHEQLPAARHVLVRKLEDWTRDPDLAGLRGRALDMLDPAEQPRWRALWAAVDQVLSQSKFAAN